VHDSYHHVSLDSETRVTLHEHFCSLRVEALLAKLYTPIVNTFCHVIFSQQVHKKSCVKKRVIKWCKFMVGARGAGGRGSRIILTALIAHHTPTATSCGGSRWINMNKTGNESINAIMRCVRKPNFWPLKSSKYYILGVCVCSLLLSNT